MRTLGVDLGTSGVRAVVLDGTRIVGSHAVSITAADRRNPDALWAAVTAVLGSLDLAGVCAIAIAGTSGTVLPVGDDGRPLGALSLYSDAAPAQNVAAIDRVAPVQTAARGGTSPLARAMSFQEMPGLHRVLHEAEWIAGMFCGRFDATDANNALKTGYDPAQGRWPAWIADAGLRPVLLPDVLAPGALLAPVTQEASRQFGMPRDAIVVAGTTDGCASFLSTGAAEVGDGVTSLGSTLTLKLLSDTPVVEPGYGIYSHLLLGWWLAGGASNAGGEVLAAHFDPARLRSLSGEIDPGRCSGLDYHPLLRPGERFPINDPNLAPRLEPRPSDDAAFLQGMLEGIARIEAWGYRRLAELGAPPVRRVLTVGGGAANEVWTAMRARILGVPVLCADTSSAAHGAAMLARRALA